MTRIDVNAHSFMVLEKTDCTNSVTCLETRERTHSRYESLSHFGGSLRDSLGFIAEWRKNFLFELNAFTRSIS